VITEEEVPLGSLQREKLNQAPALLAQAGVDAWITFDSETAEGGDPVLPLLVDCAFTWQTVLLIAPSGRRLAIAGRYDAPLLEAEGNWDEIVPYDQSLREPLLQALERTIPPEKTSPRIAVNFSTSDDKSDGLSHGSYLLLEQYLQGTRFAGSLVSAEEIIGNLRSRKTPDEVARMRAAIAQTDRLFAEAAAFAVPDRSEAEIYRFVQERMDERRLGYSWDRRGDPIVNLGPESVIGHGLPSPTIRLRPGWILHLDLGVILDGYSSDMQRCWYRRRPAETAPPPEVLRGLQAVNGAIDAGARLLRPGIEGWQVDAAARAFVVAQGYPEYQHALGHQIGRLAHDGGALLGPRWERYGRTPTRPVQEGQVFTLELGVMAEGCGFIGIEEMVRVTRSGCEWLTERQREMWLL